MLYWRYGDYAGVGPGAHSRLTLEGGERIGASMLKSPEAWLAQVDARGEGIEETEQLAGEDQADEYLLMGLRLNDGISLKRHGALGGALDRGRVETLERFVDLRDREGQP